MRHGTLAEYVAGCRCDDCRWANARYHKGLVLDMSRGIRRLIDATGTRRRIHALQALGWTLQDIADAAGVELPLVDQLARRGYIEVGVRLPSGQRAELRLPDRWDAASVRVRTEPGAVAVIGA